MSSKQSFLNRKRIHLLYLSIILLLIFVIVKGYYNSKIHLIEVENLKTELETISSIYGKEKQISFTSYMALVIPEKVTYFPGENFKGKIAIGRLDDSIIPNEVVVNGKIIKSTDIRDNFVELNLPVGNIGENQIEGKFIFLENGRPIEVPIESSYMVIPKFK